MALRLRLFALADFLTNVKTTKHDSAVTSVSLSQAAARHLRKVRSGPLDLVLLQECLDGLLSDRAGDIFRIKGVLSVAHADDKYVCQAVHMIFSDDFDEPWAEGEPRVSKVREGYTAGCEIGSTAPFHRSPCLLRPSPAA